MMLFASILLVGLGFTSAISIDSMIACADFGEEKYDVGAPM